MYSSAWLDFSSSVAAYDRVAFVVYIYLDRGPSVSYTIIQRIDPEHNDLYIHI